MKKYIRLMRIKHYIKNGLCMLPLFFSGHLLDPKFLIRCIEGTLVFSLITSIVYIVNDINDIEKDRNHPVKCKRPLASGDISVNNAKYLIVGLTMVCLWAMYIWKFSGRTILFALLFLVINIFYSKKGKNIPVLEIFLLGAGYPIRIFYGGSLIGTPISSWLFLTVTCVALYLGFGKRYGELLQCKNKRLKEIRPVLQNYSVDFLLCQMYVCLGMGLVFYSLWTIEREQQLIYTVPIVIAICMKYNLMINKKQDGDPIELLVSDYSILVLIGIYIILLLCMLYIF